MHWRSLLGLDLSGKLRKWKQYYRGSDYHFDYQHIECSICGRDSGPWHLLVNCACDDPTNAPATFGNKLWIYRSKDFATKELVTEHMNNEVLLAAKRHADAGFYRHVRSEYQEFGEPLDNGTTGFISQIYEKFVDDRWCATDYSFQGRPCVACGAVGGNSVSICNACGEPLVG